MLNEHDEGAMLAVREEVRISRRLAMAAWQWSLFYKKRGYYRWGRSGRRRPTQRRAMGGCCTLLEACCTVAVTGIVTLHSPSDFAQLATGTARCRNIPNRMHVSEMRVVLLMSGVDLSSLCAKHCARSRVDRGEYTVFQCVTICPANLHFPRLIPFLTACT